MDALMLIILLIIIIICIIFGIYINLYNKMQDYVIRINEVEMSIDTSLRNKYDNINRVISIAKANDKVSKNGYPKIFDEIAKLKNMKISNFDLYRKLVGTYGEFLSLKDKYKELEESDEIKNLIKKIEDADETLDVNIDYYNKNITEYNKLIKLFPTNIVASICKYKEKLFFDKKDMSDEDYDDFKL